MGSSYSVIIPVYNAQNFILDTIDSVLNQILPPTEIIIIDDCSTDSSFELIGNHYRNNSTIKLYKNEKNLGVAETRNLGMQLAQGKYISFLDSDDLWQQNKMKTQIAVIESTNADFSYTAYGFINDTSYQYNYIYNVPKSLDLKDLLAQNYIGLSSVVIKADIAKTYQFSGDYAHEDFVFWLSILRDGKKAVGINKPLMLYRIHKNNRSANKTKAAADRWNIYRNFLGLSLIRSTYYFIIYAINGIIKRSRIN